MKCENFLLLADAYIEDELELQENSEVSDHLTVCESCAFSYNKIRREQEMFERYFLEAEATPALWKNLQSAIRDEKIVQPPRRFAFPGRKFEKVFRDVFLVFSPREMALAALGIFILCTFVFLFIGRENSSVEYAERNNEILPFSKVAEKIEQSSLVSGVNQKENAQINQTTLTPKTNARRLRVRQFQRPSEKPNALSQRNSEIASSQTKSENNLLPDEQKYLATIARLTAEVKSVETNMPPVLSVEYKRNLSTVDQAITETRSAAQRYPKNPDVANFVLSAYRGKIALLTEVAKRSKSSIPGF